MNILSRYGEMRDSACFYARELEIDHYDVRIWILKLPHPHKKMGYVEYPSSFGNKGIMEVYVKLDDEREYTLAHEMVHVRQILAASGIDEIEAEKTGQFLAEKRLTMTHIM